jgi:hypothetical protein
VSMFHLQESIRLPSSGPRGIGPEAALVANLHYGERLLGDAVDGGGSFGHYMVL